MTTRLPATSSSSGKASRPSLSNVVAGIRALAMPAAASAAAVPGPGAKVGSVAGHKYGAGTPYSTALADTKIAMSYAESDACARSRGARSAGGRMTIAGNTMGTASSAASCCASPAAWRAGRVTITPTPASGPLGAAAFSGEGTLIVEWGASCRDESRRAARQEIVGEIGPQTRGGVCIRNVTLDLAAQDVLAVATRDETAKPQGPLFPFRVGRERRVAAAAKGAGERALGRGGERCSEVGKGRQRGHDIGAVDATLERQRALPRCGQAVIRVEQCRDSRGESQALQSSRSQNDGVVASDVELAQPRIDVAAQRLDPKMRMAVAQLRLAPQTRRADERTRRQFRETRALFGHQRLTWVLARSDGRQHESRRHFHRHVLQRMHGEIGPALVHRDFEFLDEKPFAADVRERLIDEAVALRRHSQQVDRHSGIARDKPRPDVLGLPERERGLAGRD